MWVGVGLFLYVWFNRHLGLSHEKEKRRGENVTPQGHPYVTVRGRKNRIKV